MALLYVLLPATEVAPDPSPHDHELLRERVAALLAPYAADLEVDEHDELCDCTLDPQVGLMDRLISLGLAIQVKEPSLRALRRERANLAAGPRQRAFSRCPVCAGAGSYRSVRNPEARWSRWTLRDDPPWPVPHSHVLMRPTAVLRPDGAWVDGATYDYGYHTGHVVVAVDYQP